MLFRSVGITAGSSLEDVKTGAGMLAARSSGNFAIDATYDEAVFLHFDRFVDSEPAAVVEAVADSGMRLLPWIARSSDGALRAMNGAPEATVDVMLALEGPRETADRLLHLLARRDPQLAAQLAGVAAHREGGAAFVVALLRRFAYDGYWSDRNAGPNVRPAQVADFFAALSTELGSESVLRALRVALLNMENEVDEQMVEAGGGDAMLHTLEAARDASSGGRRELMELLIRESGLS